MRKQVLFGVLAVVLLFGLVGMASADQAIYNLAGNTQTGNVNVTASVNPKITLTIDTPAVGQTVAFGAVDPGAAIPGQTVNLAVDSNKAFALTSVADTTAFGGITLNRDLADSPVNAKGQAVPFADNYSIDVPWTTDPGAYTALVTYTVVQN